MQTLMVIILIAAALTYLGMRFYKTWAGKQQKGCEKCGIRESPKPTSKA